MLHPRTSRMLKLRSVMFVRCAKLVFALQDLPELFLGKPRPYSIHDIEEGMKAAPGLQSSTKHRCLEVNRML